MANAQPCAERVYINVNAPPGFQLRQKILGDSNANLQYISQETRANVELRGGTEPNDPLYLMIEHPALKNLIEAKNLAKNLIETIHQDLQVFLQSNQQIQSQQQPPPNIQTVSHFHNPKLKMLTSLVLVNAANIDSTVGAFVSAADYPQPAFHSPASDHFQQRPYADYPTKPASRCRNPNQNWSTDCSLSRPDCQPPANKHSNSRTTICIEPSSHAAAISAAVHTVN